MNFHTGSYLYVILLCTGAIISLLTGLAIMFKQRSLKTGYVVLFLSSLIFLIALISWFHLALAKLSIDTIPIILDQVLPIIIYPFYLIVTWLFLFIFKKIFNIKGSE